jgi:hypothetical protein
VGGTLIQGGRLGGFTFGTDLDLRSQEEAAVTLGAGGEPDGVLAKHGLLAMRGQGHFTLAALQVTPPAQLAPAPAQRTSHVPPEHDTAFAQEFLPWQRTTLS